MRREASADAPETRNGGRRGAPPPSREERRPVLGDPLHPSATLPPILCYHKVEPRHELGVTRIGPKRFARQIERLAARGWRTLTLAEIESCARGERPVRGRELAITFDDAYRGLRDHAFPVLRAHGFGAVCFVITEYAGRLNRWDVAYGGRRFAHLAWRDMRAWQARGIEFGSHTATHPRLTWQTVDEARVELSRSRAALAGALDIDVTTVSYPFGAAGVRERELARAAGYTSGFALAHRWTGDAMAIARVPVYLWSPPLPGVGVLAPIERLGAAGVNRCAVGTSIWRHLRQHSRG